jgi:hypothetical protein
LAYAVILAVLPKPGTSCSLENAALRRAMRRAREGEAASKRMIFPRECVCVLCVCVGSLFLVAQKSCTITLKITNNGFLETQKRKPDLVDFCRLPADVSQAEAEENPRAIKRIEIMLCCRTFRVMDRAQTATCNISCLDGSAFQVTVPVRVSADGSQHVNARHIMRKVSSLSTACVPRKRNHWTSFDCTGHTHWHVPTAVEIHRMI